MNSAAQNAYILAKAASDAAWKRYNEILQSDGFEAAELFWDDADMDTLGNLLREAETVLLDWSFAAATKMATKSQKRTLSQLRGALNEPEMYNLRKEALGDAMRLAA